MLEVDVVVDVALLHQAVNFLWINVLMDVLMFISAHSICGVGIHLQNVTILQEFNLDLGEVKRRDADLSLAI